MDTLELRDGRNSIAIFINGVRFQHLAPADGHMQDYLDLRRSDLPLPDHFYGKTDVIYSRDYEFDLAPADDQDPITLACACGDSGCDSVTVHISVSNDVVTWSNVRPQPAGASLGPFAFERAQYDDAVAALTARTSR